MIFKQITLITHKLCWEGVKYCLNKHPCTELSYPFDTEYLFQRWFKNYCCHLACFSQGIPQDFVEAEFSTMSLAYVLLKSSCSTALWSTKHKTNMGSKVSTGVVKWLVICQLEQVGHSSSPPDLWCPFPKQASIWNMPHLTAIDVSLNSRSTDFTESKFG